MIEDTSVLLESAMVDPATGIHNPAVQEPPPLTPSAIAEVLKDPMLFDENGDNGECVYEREGERVCLRESQTIVLQMFGEVEKSERERQTDRQRRRESV